MLKVSFTAQLSDLKEVLMGSEKALNPAQGRRLFKPKEKKAG